MQSIIRLKLRQRLRQTRKSLRKSNKDATRTQGRIAQRWKVARRIWDQYSGWGNVARAPHTLPLNVYARLEGNATIMGPSTRSGNTHTHSEWFLRAKVARPSLAFGCCHCLRSLRDPCPRSLLRVHLGYKWFSYACSLGDLFVLFLVKRHSNERGVKSRSRSESASGSLTSVWTRRVMELCTNFQ